MQLTTAVVVPFVGGQAEIQNRIEEYIFRGEIETIIVEGDELRIRFKWCAKGEGYPPIPTKWVNEPKLDYAVSLMTSSASNIRLNIGGGNRLAINTGFVSNELIVLFPPDGSKLDPALVEGLTVAS